VADAKKPKKSEPAKDPTKSAPTGQSAPINPNPEPEIEFNVVSDQVRKRNAREPSVWIFAPGNIQLLKWGERSIGALGINGGPPVTYLEFIRAARVRDGTRRVYLMGTNDKDPNAVEVKRKRGRVTANFSDSFVAWGFALEVNTAARYRLTPSTPNDRIHPSMILDLSAPLDPKSIKKQQTQEEKEQAKQVRAEKALAKKAKQEQAKQEQAKQDQAPGQEPNPDQGPA